MGIQWIPLAVPIPQITHPKHLKGKIFQGFYSCCGVIWFLVYPWGKGIVACKKFHGGLGYNFFGVNWQGLSTPLLYALFE